MDAPKSVAVVTKPILKWSYDSHALTQWRNPSFITSLASSHSLWTITIAPTAAVVCSLMLLQSRGHLWTFCIVSAILFRSCPCWFDEQLKLDNENNDWITDKWKVFIRRQNMDNNSHPRDLLQRGNSACQDIRGVLSVKEVLELNPFVAATPWTLLVDTNVGENSSASTCYQIEQNINVYHICGTRWGVMNEFDEVISIVHIDFV